MEKLRRKKHLLQKRVKRHNRVQAYIEVSETNYGNSVNRRSIIDETVDSTGLTKNNLSEYFASIQLYEIKIETRVGFLMMSSQSKCV